MKRSLIRELVKKYLMEQKEESPESSYKFKALVITGPAGSGKTFTSQKIGVPSNLMRNVLNTDEQVEKLFPEYGLTLKFAHRSADEADTDDLADAQVEMRKIAKQRTGERAVQLVDRGDPIFIDTTGEDPGEMKERINSLTDLGYDVGVVQIMVPKELSLARDVGRKRTVGSFTGKIWDDYKENVIDNNGYVELLGTTPEEKQSQAFVINPDPFYNVYNLGGDVKNKEGEVLFPGRSTVPEVEQLAAAGKIDKDKEIPVSIEDMDKVFADMQKGIKDFLAGGEVRNPVGQTMVKAFDAMTRAGIDGRISNIPIYLALVKTGDVKAYSKKNLAAVEKAGKVYNELSDRYGDGEDVDNITNLMKLSAKYRGERDTVATPEEVSQGLRAKQKAKFEKDPAFAEKIRAALADLPSFADSKAADDKEKYNKRALIVYRYGDPDNLDAWKEIERDMLTEQLRSLMERVDKMIEEGLGLKKK